jgi:hypothetical protein
MVEKKIFIYFLHEYMFQIIFPERNHPTPILSILQEGNKLCTLIKKKDTRVHDYRKELVYTINLLILQEGNTRIFLPNPPSNFL